MAKKRIGKLARRYAKALLNTVQGQSIEAAAKALEAFSLAFAGSRELQNGLLSPMFEREERQKALEKLGESSQLPVEVTRFLSVVFERDRLALIGEISLAFRSLADEAARTVQVDVTTAKDLAENERRELESSLTRTVGGNALFHWSVDASLIGGMTVQYGGKVIDGSVRGRLQNIERELLSA